MAARIRTRFFSNEPGRDKAKNPSVIDRQTNGQIIHMNKVGKRLRCIAEVKTYDLERRNTAFEYTGAHKRICVFQGVFP